MKTNQFNFMKRKFYGLLILALILACNSCIQKQKLVSEYDPSEFRKQNLLNWEKFNKQHNNKWKVVWDENSGTPHRISGYYIEYDQAITEENLKNISGDFLNKHSKLLQIDIKQLKLSKIDIEKIKTKPSGNAFVYYKQYYKGIPVYGGNVRLIFHGKKLSVINSDYFPGIRTKTSPTLNEKKISEIAANSAASKDVKAPEKIRLIIYPAPIEKKIKYHLAYEVIMPVIKVPGHRIEINPETEKKDNLVPVKWKFFIDANTGIILDRINLIKDEDLNGSVTAMVYPATPADTQIDRPLEGMNISITQGLTSLTASTNATGNYQFLNLTSGSIDVEAHLKGPHVRVYNTETGEPGATFATTTVPGILDWNWSSYDPSPNDVESNAFYHVGLIRNYYRQGGPFNITPVSPVGPSEDYIDVRVREDYCNAYAYIGSGMITFGDDDNCEDFGLCADIIYHEYTHLVVQQIYDDAGVNIWNCEHGGAFHEGFSDYFGCSITGNPHHGGGCWSGRHIDSPDKKYPENYTGGSHSDGMIISGALWDVRDILGAEYTSNMAIRALKHAPATFSEYLDAVLEEDDNTAYSSDPSANDFPEDGTPNIDVICQSFYDKHGIFHSYCEGHTDLPIAILTAPSPLNTEMNYFDNSVTQIQILGTALGSGAGGLQQYTIEYMSADAVGTWSSTGINLIGNGINPIENDILGTLDFSTIADGFYLLKLEVTDNANQTAIARARMYVDKDIMSGWPKETNQYFPCVPVVADIDPGFSGEEIIARERWGTLFAYHLDGSAVQGWPQFVYHYPLVPPAAADLNADGIPDVVAAGGNTLYGFTNAGADLPGWPVTLDRDINNFYSMAIADIDGDNLPEVVLAIEEGYIYMYNHDGSLAPGWPVFTGANISVDLAVADLDGQLNGFEIVVCDDSGELKVLKADGSIIPGWPQAVSTAVKASPAVADLDGDSSLEIVVGTNSSVYGFHHDGSPVSGWPVNSGFSLNYGTGMVVGDIDNDGSVEVILKGTEEVGIWNSDGTTYSNAPFVIPGSGGGFHRNSAPVVGDINLDGNYDLLDGYNFDNFGDPAIYGNIKLHRIYALDHNGNILGNWPKYLPGPYTPSMPVINDADHDGQLEMIAACFGVYVWDLPGSGPGGQLVEWGDFRHDFWRTGLYGFLVPATIYVDSSIGSDSYDGSSPTYEGNNVGPKKTIQAGVDAISAGSVCMVAAGTYTEHVIMKEGIILKGAGAEVTVIDGGGSGPVVTGADNSVIDGFTITGASPGGFPDATGILCEGTSMTIRNNIISNIAIYPVFVRNASPLILGNTIFGSGNNGIYNSHGSGTIVRNNLIYDCEDNGIYCLQTSSTLQMVNNTIVENGFGINIQNCPLGLTIINNIVAHNNTGIIVQGNPPSISYNDVWNNAQDYSGCSSGPGDISVDPQFIDLAGHDYHLQSSSPCIDAGTDVGQPYAGSAPDMGAFEFE